MVSKLLLLTIGSRNTIRRYEREGLIPQAKRSPRNGYRFWREEDVALIQEAIFGGSQAPKEGRIQKNA